MGSKYLDDRNKKVTEMSYVKLVVMKTKPTTLS